MGYKYSRTQSLHWVTATTLKEMFLIHPGKAPEQLTLCTSRSFFQPGKYPCKTQIFLSNPTSQARKHCPVALMTRENRLQAFPLVLVSLGDPQAWQDGCVAFGRLDARRDRRPPAASPSLHVQDVVEIGDVADGQAQDLDLGELLVRGQRGQQLAELGEGQVEGLHADALAGGVG